MNTDDIKRRVKLMMGVGCLKRGRCKDRMVNKDFCTVCHNGMEILRQLESNQALSDASYDIEKRGQLEGRPQYGRGKEG